MTRSATTGRCPRQPPSNGPAAKYTDAARAIHRAGHPRLPNRGRWPGEMGNRQTTRNPPSRPTGHAQGRIVTPSLVRRSLKPSRCGMAATSSSGEWTEGVMPRRCADRAGQRRPRFGVHWVRTTPKNGACRWKTSKDVSAGQAPFSATTDRAERPPIRCLCHDDVFAGLGRRHTSLRSAYLRPHSSDGCATTTSLRGSAGGIPRCARRTSGLTPQMS